MITRSRTLYEKSAIYEVKIDFDDASKAWRYNKRSVGNGTYKYICCVPDKNCKKCGINCVFGSVFCKKHYNKLNKNIYTLEDLKPHLLTA
jgi:hypothetical protein